MCWCLCTLLFWWADWLPSRLWSLSSRRVELQAVYMEHHRSVCQKLQKGLGIVGTSHNYPFHLDILSERRDSTFDFLLPKHRGHTARMLVVSWIAQISILSCVALVRDFAKPQMKRLRGANLSHIHPTNEHGFVVNIFGHNKYPPA